jgi:tetratricopeptide (TPR) repeat protein
MTMMLVPRVTGSAPPASALLKKLGTCALFSLASVAVQAQPDALVTRLLFEATAIPEDPATSYPLVSFSAAETDIPQPAAEKKELTFAERRAIEEEIDQYRAIVGDSEAEQGPFSDTLREDLYSIGELYQQLEEHEEAIKAFDRALNVSRINFGLRSLDQVSVLENMAESYLALGQNSNADAMMDASFKLQSDYYGDGSPALSGPLMKLGDWNTDAFMTRSSILVNIPRMNVQNFLMDPNNYVQPIIDIRSSPVFKLYQARSNYLNAIVSLLNNKNYAHPELQNLEHKLLTNYFLSMHQENILYEPDFYLTRKKTKTASRLNQNAIELMTSESYDLGKESHERRLAYLSNSPDTPDAELATVLLEKADWHLLFERKVVALREYEEAYRLFSENPEMAENVADIIYPLVPTILPTYLPPPNSRAKLGIAEDAPVSYFGYYDVSFSVNKYGKSRRVRILREGGEVTRNMEIRLKQYLQKVLFRPRFKDGKVDESRIELRYYIAI